MLVQCSNWPVHSFTCPRLSALQSLHMSRNVNNPVSNFPSIWHFLPKKNGPAILVGLVAFRYHLNRKLQSQFPLSALCTYARQVDSLSCSKRQNPLRFVPRSWNNDRVAILKLTISLAKIFAVFIFALTIMPAKNIKVCTTQKFPTVQ